MSESFIKIDEFMINKFLKRVNYDFPIPLEKKVNINEYSRKILNGTIKAYINNNEILALVAGYTENIVNNSAYISIVAVDKRARRKGIAKSLINEFINECSKKGIESINLYTHNTNINAIKMYKDLGFKEEKSDRESDIHLIYRII